LYVEAEKNGAIKNLLNSNPILRIADQRVKMDYINENCKKIGLKRTFLSRETDDSIRTNTGFANSQTSSLEQRASRLLCNEAKQQRADILDRLIDLSKQEPIE